VRRVPLVFKARIPKGVTDEETVCAAGQSGKGLNGGSNGNLYLIVLPPDGSTVRTLRTIC